MNYDMTKEQLRENAIKDFKAGQNSVLLLIQTDFIPQIKKAKSRKKRKAAINSLVNLYGCRTKSISL